MQGVSLKHLLKVGALLHDRSYCGDFSVERISD